MLWAWLVVEVLAGDRRLIIDFAETTNPLAAGGRLALPELRSPIAGDWLRYAAWAAAAGRRRRRLAVSPAPRSQTHREDPHRCRPSLGRPPSGALAGLSSSASPPAPTTTAARSATSAATKAPAPAHRARRRARLSGSAARRVPRREPPAVRSARTSRRRHRDRRHHARGVRLRPAAVEVAAGVVTFAASNAGTENHELAFLPGGGDVPLTEDGAPDEDALADAGAFELEAFGPGQTCNATYELEAGTYTLFCIVEADDGETHARRA